MAVRAATTGPAAATTGAALRIGAFLYATGATAACNGAAYVSGAFAAIYGDE